MSTTSRTERTGGVAIYTQCRSKATTQWSRGERAGAMRCRYVGPSLGSVAMRDVPVEYARTAHPHVRPADRATCGALLTDDLIL